MNAHSVPLSTYRLQFNSSFTFRQAADLVPYLAQLGISHCYASPYLRARPGSNHGYDIIDHNSLNPEIGAPEDFEALVSALRDHGMGQVLDIVPNHMGIMGSDNAWWLDVLENGESSVYADFFDIDWQPVKDELRGKVLVPVLGDQYGTVLDRGELELRFDHERGEFSVYYSQHRFPVSPREYPRVLNYKFERLVEILGAESPSLLELQSLIAAFTHLPSRFDTAPEKKAERTRDKEIHKRRLGSLCTQTPVICEFIDGSVREINGTPGDSQSFDTLHELIKAQAYRLAYWRVAADDINYRRFFDINDLAGIRMENQAVFDATHRLVLEFLKEGKIDGLRIDHPDGLYNPSEYFHRLQCGRTCPGQAPPCDTTKYVVIEKILTGDEPLPGNWPVNGTTGYEFINLVNGLFVDSSAHARMKRAYRAFVGQQPEFDELVYRCKKQVMDGPLGSELQVLASLLSRIALADRHTCDFTLNGLREALSEVIACFPVYRTYITREGVSDRDRWYIEQAITGAQRRSSLADASVFDFVRSVLLTAAADGHVDYYQRAVFRFAMKFQQFTSVVMAKGVEDTAFYRAHCLVSLNEVGGDPRRFGTSVAEFHHLIQERAQNWSGGLSASSTHDTKRSEDVRARINVLSEMPALWRRSVRRWRTLNQGKKQVLDGRELPTRNDEYLLYQTLVGAWPFEAKDEGTSFVQRIKDYMLKAVREAKELTSWSNRNVEYERSVERFIEAVLDEQGASEFLADFRPFQQRVAQIGMLNGLSQTLIKLTAPGVPDLYQGTEIWDFSLVDPDNRRPVDYARRRRLLEHLQRADVQEAGAKKEYFQDMLEHMEDGRLKLYITWKALQVRRQYPEVFQQGTYVPVCVRGPRADNLIAYVRGKENISILVVVPRLCSGLLPDPSQRGISPEMWNDTTLEMWEQAPALSFEDLLTSNRWSISKSEGPLTSDVSLLLHNFPVGLFLVRSS